MWDTVLRWPVSIDAITIDELEKAALTLLGYRSAFYGDKYPVSDITDQSICNARRKLTRDQLDELVTMIGSS